MIDVLIIAPNGVARIFLTDINWLTELAVLRAIIAHPIAINAVCEPHGSRNYNWWHDAQKT